MVAMLRKLGVSSADVDDVAQEVLCGAWRSIQAGAFRPSSGKPFQEAFLSWLRGVAWRHASHHRQSAWQRRARPTADVSEYPDEGMALQEARVAACEDLQALVGIPGWARQVLMLHCGEGRGPSEIARAQGCSINTARNRLRLARRHFVRALRRRGS